MLDTYGLLLKQGVSKRFYNISEDSLHILSLVEVVFRFFFSSMFCAVIISVITAQSATGIKPESLEDLTKYDIPIILQSQARKEYLKGLSFFKDLEPKMMFLPHLQEQIQFYWTEVFEGRAAFIADELALVSMENTFPFDFRCRYIQSNLGYDNPAILHILGTLVSK